MTTTGEPTGLLSPAAIPADRRFGPLDWAVAAALWAVAFALFIRARSYGYIYFDDQIYADANAYVHAGLSWAGVKYAFTHLIVGNWHPLTLLTMEALSSAFGPSAATFHTANVVLHAVAVAMLYAWLRVATNRAGPAAAVALLWGLHPLRVESVAWVAELKDELSSVTWLATLLVYVGYSARGRTGRWYAAVVGCYALAILSKPSAVTLPVVLLLTDLWPRGRADLGSATTTTTSGGYWGRRVLEKVPLFVLAAGTAAGAIFGQDAPQTLFAIPFPVRAANAVLSLAIYLRQMVWPAGLAVFYPHPYKIQQPIGAGVVIGSAVLVLALSAAVIATARRRPYLFVGWFWFLIVIAPNLGLLQAGEQARADRFTLLPAIGLTIAVVYGLADALRTRPAEYRMAGALAALAAVALAAGTWLLLPSWKDSAAVWDRADAVVEHNYMAHAERAFRMAASGQPVLGEQMAKEAIAWAPVSAGGYAALANALAAESDADPSKVPAAMKAYDDAVHHDGANPVLRYAAGHYFARIHKDSLARRQFKEALKLDPTLVDAELALGTLLTRSGDYPGAVERLRHYLAVVPHDSMAEGTLGDALRLGGDTPAAAAAYGAAYADGSRDPQWQAWRAWLVGQDAASTPEQLAAAVEPAEMAVGATHDVEPFPLYAYSLVLARLNRTDDATRAGERALAVARQTGRTDMARDIARRLVAYRAGLPSTRPTTRATTGPTTRP